MQPQVWRLTSQQRSMQAITWPLVACRHGKSSASLRLTTLYGHALSLLKQALGTHLLFLSTIHRVSTLLASCFSPWRAQKASTAEIFGKNGENYKIPFPASTPENGEIAQKRGKITNLGGRTEEGSLAILRRMGFPPQRLPVPSQGETTGKTLLSCTDPPNGQDFAFLHRSPQYPLPP